MRHRRLPGLLLTVALFAMAACGATGAAPSGSATRPAGKSAAPVAAKPSAAPATRLTNVTLLLDFVPEGDHAPLYYARAKGFFKAQGLNVTIVPGKGSGNTVQEVGAGVYPFGFADASTAAIAISRGVPVVVVDDYFQRNPAALVYPLAKPLSKPSDVAGKTIAENPNGAAAKLFRALLSANHMSQHSFKVANVTASTLIPSLAIGRVNGVVTTEEVALPEIEAKGIRAGALLFSDWGISALSTGIIVNRTYLRQHPKIVQGFVTAANQGWVAAMAHPRQAVAAESKAVGPNLMPPNAVQMLKLSEALLHTKRTQGRPLGWMAAQDWRDTLAVLRRYFALKKVLPLNRYYTDRFIPS